MNNYQLNKHLGNIILEGDWYAPPHMTGNLGWQYGENWTNSDSPELPDYCDIIGRDYVIILLVNEGIECD